MKTFEVIPIPALRDNYVWLIRKPDSPRCAVVDPGDAVPVLDYLQRLQLQLTAILITHHHPDHVGGLAELKRHFPDCVVFGPNKENISLLDHKLTAGAVLRLPDLALDFKVIEVPGHTHGHIAYYSENQCPLLFCGDVLFSAGCGRLFEGTAEQLHDSLQRLTRLPGETEIYPGHEYTLKNSAFALLVEPENATLQAWKLRAVELRAQKLPTLPTTLLQELALNPFLRTHISAVKQSAERYSGITLRNPVDVFRVLRQWKDAF